MTYLRKNKSSLEVYRNGNGEIRYITAAKNVLDEIEGQLVQGIEIESCVIKSITGMFCDSGWKTKRS